MDSAVHVLIVDDDPAIRALLRAALRDDDWDVHEAPDGVLALERLRASTMPLIVLLDWHMPRLGGRGVLRVVAADRRLAATHRFVLLTAAAVPEDAESTALLDDLGVPVLRKPFDLDALIEAVAWAAAYLRVGPPSLDARWHC
jgi:CheY-like chemotaxis protein